MSISSAPSSTATLPADKAEGASAAPTKTEAPALSKPAKKVTPSEPPAVKRVAVKRSAATPWVDTLPKPAAKLPAKPDKKPATKPATKAVSAKVAASKKAPKPTKPPATPKPKVKLVRDSFTMPQVDFDLITVLKDRALVFKRPTKKSELLRAGLQVLAGLSPDALKQSLGHLAPLKAGRPKKADWT